MKSLWRTLLAATVLAVPALPSLAETPRDYVMPYTPRQPSAFQAEGIMLVNSANFAQTAELQLPNPNSKGFRSPRVHYSGSVSGGQIADFRPQLLSIAYGSRWARVDLRAGLAPAVEIISSETGTANACESQSVVRDYRNASNAALIYRIASGCPEVGGTIRAISMNDGPATAPVTLPLDRVEIQPHYNNSGVLQFVFAYDGSAKVLRRFAPDLRSHRVVASNIETIEFHGQTADGTGLLVINRALRRILPNGNLVGAPVKRPAVGYEISQVLSEGADLFFTESVVLPTVPTFPPPELPAIRSRIFVAPIAGGERPRRIANLRVTASLSGVTPTRVIYTAGGFDPITFVPAPADVVSIPREGGKAIRLQRVPVSQQSFGSVTVNAVVGDRVFYTTSVIEPGSTTFGVQRAFAKTDMGVRLSDQRPGSSWAGTQFAGFGDLRANAAGEVRLLLARRGVDGTGAGAQLLSVVPETLALQALTKLPQTDTVFLVNGFGAGALGSVIRQLSRNQFTTDLFAFDLFNSRFRRLNEGTVPNEAPLF